MRPRALKVLPQLPRIAINSSGGTIKHLGKKLIIIAIWIVLWQILAWLVANPFLLCGPWEALQALGANLITAQFWSVIAGSFSRIALGFLVASILGVFLGAGAGKWPWVADGLAPLVSVIKSTPVVCIIALLLVWWGSAATTSIVVGLVVFPPFYFALIEATKTRNPQTEEMLRLFAVPWTRRLGFVRWPAASPFVQTALKTAIGMAWKSGVAAELIGLPRASIGEQIYLAKLSLDTADIIAWTAMVIFLGWLTEVVVCWIVGALGRLPKNHLRRQAQDGLKAWEAQEAGNTGGTNLDLPAFDAVEVSFDVIAKAFDGQRVFEGFSAILPAGSHTCVMAPSGTGKTTLLHMAARLIAPDRGAISMNGSSNSEAYGVPVAMVFQESRLINGLSALENLRLTARGDQEYFMALRAASLLFADTKDVPFPTLMERPVEQFSGGMRRRLEIARALGFAAPLVLLDEPFSGLDDTTTETTAAVILRFLKGRTLLVATHDKNAVELLNANLLQI